jgi:thiol-disulfide isomerase/thioredoxin
LRLKQAKIAPALTLASLLAFLLIGCGGDSRGISSKIPELSLKTHLGKDFKLDGNSKETTLLVFWATWCGPCMMEIPSLIVLQEKYRDRNFRVVSILLDDPEGQKAPILTSRYGINYTILLGSDETTRQFGGVHALPTSFLIKDGKIREKVMGLVPEEEMERKVQKLLEGAG